MLYGIQTTKGIQSTVAGDRTSHLPKLQDDANIPWFQHVPRNPLTNYFQTFAILCPRALLEGQTIKPHVRNPSVFPARSLHASSNRLTCR